jgi:hypothetical protein
LRKEELSKTVDVQEIRKQTRNALMAIQNTFAVQSAGRFEGDSINL